MKNLRELLLEKNRIEFYYTPRRGDIIVKVYGNVTNPHNKFGEKILYKKKTFYLLVRDTYLYHPSREGWYFCYWEVHKCLRTSWLDEVVPDIEIETEIFEVGEFVGLGKHDETIVRKWGSVEHTFYINVGSEDNTDRFVSYYIPVKEFLEKLTKFYREKYNFSQEIKKERLIYMGSVILIEPWNNK